MNNQPTIDRSKVNIPGAGNEEIVISTRRHWASMLGEIVMILAMIFIPFIFVFGLTFTGKPQIFFDHIVYFVPFIAFYYLVITTFIFVEWVNYYYSLFFLTEDEIIDITQQGFFNRVITQISIIRIQDVSASVKGFLPTMFGYGDVIAESAGDNTRNYIVEKVPRPMDLADKIVEIHDRQLRRQGPQDESGYFNQKAEASSKDRPPCSPITPSQPIKPITFTRQNIVSTPVPDNNQNQTSQPAQPQSEQGNVSSDDLNKGGEVKF